jgi:nucleotide-binding universal stress UspA family protein
MKKILLAFDGTTFSEGAFAFAKWMNEKEKILLTGAFLPQVALANLWSMSGGAMNGPVYIPLVEEEDVAQIAHNMTRFKDLCEENGIAFTIHKDFNGFAVQELVAESRFADMLILSSEKFYESSGQAIDFLEDALHGVECPVIVVPEQFDLPTNIILAYDGEQSSVFAAKQFTWLFPDLCKLPSLLAYAGKDDNGHMPAEKNMEEWAGTHFSELTMAKLDEDGRKYFTDWFRDKKNTLLVTGSFGRSAISRVLRKSFTSDIIALHSTPVFIAHN